MFKRLREARLRSRLRGEVNRYLNANVVAPSLETVDSSFSAQARLASMLLMVKNLVRLVVEHGTDLDKEYLSSLSEDEVNKRLEVLEKVINSDNWAQLEERVNIEEAKGLLSEGSSRKYLLTYLIRELNWIVISILSASYISSFILMRSVFELIVGISSRQTGKMKTRIVSITFLDESEKRTIYKLWKQLCAWGHPYGKWIKEVCPIYSAHKPIYHPALCDMCLTTFQKIVDLFSVVALTKFEIDPKKFIEMVNHLHIDVTNLELLKTRLKT